ncbi:MAG: ubiquitin-binding protein [Rhodobiaceae bacterium]|nr:ubiquitin-binding protein [Rhodobiaceae bacterium]|tara:strand:+ start:1940 stop:2125 length:186 start_codon:yes stop_codon:yes gene_type:complete
MIEKLFLAIGLVLAFEGALYALFPSFLRSIVRQIDSVSDAALRNGGLVALLIGVVFVWMLG